MLRRTLFFHPHSLIVVTSTLTTINRSCSNTNSQQPQIPDVLKQFDQLMKTNVEFRQLYPKLLKAIVCRSKSDVVTIANKMVDITSDNQQQQQKVDAKSEDKGEEKKPSMNKDSNEGTSISSSSSSASGLSLIVVDVAFADMFYHASEDHDAEENADDSSATVNPLKQEETDEQLLELLLSYYANEFKQQKARIGKFIVEVVQEERDKLMQHEKGLKLLRPYQQSQSAATIRNGKSRSSSSSVLPNFAINVTPPIDENNTITADELLNQIKRELPIMSDILDGGKQAVVSSVLKRRVFSGGVVAAEDEEEIQKLTQSLFEKQKKKSIGNVEFDPDVQLMACRVAVENNLVEKRRKSTENMLLMRFDIGIEENSFAKAIGLDLYFDFEKDGDFAVRQVEQCANKICKRVSQRLNSGFRNASNNQNEKQDSVYQEEVILPFAFTMRCKIF